MAAATKYVSLLLQRCVSILSPVNYTSVTQTTSPRHPLWDKQRTIFVTHQSYDVPGVAAAERLEALEGDGDHDEDDVGAEVDPQVGLHSLLDRAGEGEHAHHAEGEQQLDGHEAEHLHGKT